MLGAGAAAKRDLPAQSLASAMNTYCGIVSGNAGFLGKLLHGEPIHFETAKGVPILGLERVKELGNTLANDCLQRRIRFCPAVHLAGQPIERSRRSSSASMVIYDRVAQGAIKPGDHQLIFTQGLDTLKPPRERLLKDILGSCPVAHPALQKRKKRAVVGNQRLHYCLGDGLSNLITFCLHRVMGTAHKNHFPSRRGFRQATPVMRGMPLRLHA